MMKRTALITGASSGIGRELAIIHARSGGDLVLAGRDKEALETLSAELSTRFAVSSLVIPGDLRDEESCHQLYRELEIKGIGVDYLINNAGFGGRGHFHDLPADTHTGMIDVNIRALTLLTRLFVPAMVARGYGRILNIASSAAFLPGPMQAVYYASKSYVLSLSLALSEELRSHGITVTASCPGPVSTEFFRRANMQNATLTRFAQRADVVAARAYRAMLKGQRISYSSFWLRALPLIMPLWNTRLLLKTSRRSMEM